MRVRATVSDSKFTAGVEYDLPDNEAMAAIIAGTAQPVGPVAQAFERETAESKEAKERQSRWRTR